MSTKQEKTKSKYGKKNRTKERGQGYSTRPGSPFYVPPEMVKLGGVFVDARPLTDRCNRSRPVIRPAQYGELEPIRAAA